MTDGSPPQAILVYDCGSRRSFEELDSWIAEASKYGARDIPVVVCCNKVSFPLLSTGVVWCDTLKGLFVDGQG